MKMVEIAVDFNSRSHLPSYSQTTDNRSAPAKKKKTVQK